MNKDEFVQIIAAMREEIVSLPDCMKRSRIPDVPEMLEVCSPEAGCDGTRYADFIHMEFFGTYCRFEVFDEIGGVRIDDVSKEELLIPYRSIIAIERITHSSDGEAYPTYRIILPRELGHLRELEYPFAYQDRTLPKPCRHIEPEQATLNRILAVLKSLLTIRDKDLPNKAIGDDEE
jgi:hypothetical protein